MHREDEATRLRGAGEPSEAPTSLASQVSERSVGVSSVSANPSMSVRSEPGERFLPGSVVAGRYRIVGLLGRGGMGEVYRADDLKLAQPVALKFLPASLEADDALLERFLSEVRIARQVAHPNVCRVYDVGEVGGQHYLSMEYIDGEDLAGLLRRIGRLPAEKATEIARQLCAGLAAAHEQGIVHRDLKPANVMLDGRGRVKITDFGLAALVDRIEGPEARSGTPAYMAPEQLEGREATTKSDLYALGLVIYELFTGKRPFEGDLASRLDASSAASGPKSMSALVDNLDPSVESAVARCLARDPKQRPGSARALAAALPGGDLLQAALEAGETPSPELVAAAGEEGVISRRAGFALATLAIVGLAVALFLITRTERVAAVPLPLTPEVLEHRASEILRALGHEELPGNDAFGFTWTSYLSEALAAEGARRREFLGEDHPSALGFWYRETPLPRPVERGSLLGNLVARTTPSDPPFDEPDMRRVVLSTNGALVQLEVLLPEITSPSAAEEPPVAVWAQLFEAAGLDLALFEPVPSRLAPALPHEGRFAWEGEHPERPEWSLRVEAATKGGKVVFFKLLGPWEELDLAAFEERLDQQRAQALGSQAVVVLLVVSVSLTLMVLAYRNHSAGRIDRRGALRLGVALFLINLVYWALYAEHFSQPAVEAFLFLSALAWALGRAAFTVVLFVALEPYIRSYWPDRMISFSRILAGRVSDPLVARDVLVGAAIVGGVTAIGWLLFAALRIADVSPPASRLDALASPRAALGLFVGHLNGALGNSLMILAVLVFCRALVKKVWLASILWLPIAFLFAWSLLGLQPGVLPVALVMLTGLAIAIFRAGLVAYSVTYYWITVSGVLPGIIDPQSWARWPAWLVFALFTATTIWAASVATRRWSGPQSESAPARR